jgi:uncharacterized protein YuzE
MGLMRFKYDNSADAAMIYLDPCNESQVVTRSELADIELKGSAFVFEFDEDDRLIAIEVLGASRVLPNSMLSASDGV